MKKTIAAMLVLLLLFPLVAMADTDNSYEINGELITMPLDTIGELSYTAQVAPEPEWAMEPTISVPDALEPVTQELRFELPATPTTGYEWTYELSDPDLLKVVNVEYISDGSEGLVGAGGIWKAAFAAAGDTAGETTLTLRYARSWENEAIKQHTFRLRINEIGEISIVGIE